MDITDIVSTEFEEFDPDTPVSKVQGAFNDPGLKAVIVSGTGGGVVTRRQLATSHIQPNRKLGSLVWSVPKVAPDEDVREVAQLMIDSGTRILPVFDGPQMVGVVTVDDLLKAVQSFIDEVTVDDVYTDHLLTIDSERTVGEALHTLRDNRITHLPVTEEGKPVGLLSLYDLTDLSSRAIEQSQGGEPSGFDAHGGEGSSGAYRSHGGFGAREGEVTRILDLPVRDLMNSPVRTVESDETLQAAVETMFDIGGSSLVVVSGNQRPIGIVTKTDIIESLTWGADGTRAVQLTGSDLVDDITYDEIVTMIDGFDDMDGDMAVIDARIHFHEHDETLRGTPLLLARIRLSTDRGLFIAKGEGYGASHAIHEARDVLERRIMEKKTYGRTKKHPDEEYWEKRFGWDLEV